MKKIKMKVNENAYLESLNDLEQININGGLRVEISIPILSIHFFFEV